MYRKTIRTIDYGEIPVISTSKYTRDNVLSVIEMDNGTFYEIKRSFGGEIVAIEI